MGGGETGAEQQPRACELTAGQTLFTHGLIRKVEQVGSQAPFAQECQAALSPCDLCSKDSAVWRVLLILALRRWGQAGVWRSLASHHSLIWEPQVPGGDPNSKNKIWLLRNNT